MFVTRKNHVNDNDDDDDNDDDNMLIRTVHNYNTPYLLYFIKT
jgi:hypothetical protein